MKKENSMQKKKNERKCIDVRHEKEEDEIIIGEDNTKKTIHMNSLF